MRGPFWGHKLLLPSLPPPAPRPPSRRPNTKHVDVGTPQGPRPDLRVSGRRSDGQRSHHRGPEHRLRLDPQVTWTGVHVHAPRSEEHRRIGARDAGVRRVRGRNVVARR